MTTPRQDLGRNFGGSLIWPGDPDYEARRAVWNASIDKHPALIARCAGVDDVLETLRFARDQDLPLAIRGGGHSFPGHSVCDDGLVVDLGPMKRIEVDLDNKTVRAQAGVLLGELDESTQRHGQAVPIGSVTHTGLAGLTLGGGIGWLMRAHGLTLDQLLSASLVTADGRSVVADAKTNPDLFWALRGGGGNFGIVTDFTFRMHPVGPAVLSSLVLWPIDQAPRIMRTYRDWIADAPEQLTTALLIRKAPAGDLIPEHLRGRLVVGVASCWIGSAEAGYAQLAPLRGAGKPAADLTTVRPFTQHQALFDASFPPGRWVYSKAADIMALTDDVLDILLDHGSRVDSPMSGAIAWQLGGAIARVGELDTAFGSRASGHLIDLTAITATADGFDAEREWARAFHAALGPYQAGVYVNWLMDEGQGSVKQAYGEQRYARLRAVKRRFDPDNVFRLNQNIPPD